MSETETHSGTATTTKYRYLGDTDADTQDTLTGDTSTTKKYAYDAEGQRVTISDGGSRYSYLYDPHGDVSLLIDQGNTVKASYGYTAYGSANATISKTASGFTDRNPYKYEGKRYDTGSNTYDMGARRYNPATGRWLQQDLSTTRSTTSTSPRTRSPATATSSPAPTPSHTLNMTAIRKRTETAAGKVRTAASHLQKLLNLPPSDPNLGVVNRAVATPEKQIR